MKLSPPGMKQKRVTVSYKEIKRIKVMELLVNGKMTKQKAAESLSLCRRQIIRLRKEYKAHGEMALIHGNRGKYTKQGTGDRCFYSRASLKPHIRVSQSQFVPPEPCLAPTYF
ncbi:MAG: hypothetical protein CSA35_06255 [Dethiosulfovibrio peptidovorans]|nr:MAG: hypothetical protein CSA35_06255 [Dethiosulfovibrio peptidovorans]